MPESSQHAPCDGQSGRPIREDGFLQSGGRVQALRRGVEDKIIIAGYVYEPVIIEFLTRYQEFLI